MYIPYNHNKSSNHLSQYSYYDIIIEVPQKLKLELLHKPAVPLLDIYPKKKKTFIWKYICTHIFIAVQTFASFTTQDSFSRTWKSFLWTIIIQEDRAPISQLIWDGSSLSSIGDLLQIVKLSLIIKIQENWLFLWKGQLAYKMVLDSSTTLSTHTVFLCASSNLS